MFFTNEQINKYRNEMKFSTEWNEYEPNWHKNKKMCDWILIESVPLFALLCKWKWNGKKRELEEKKKLGNWNLKWNVAKKNSLWIAMKKTKSWKWAEFHKVEGKKKKWGSYMAIE